MEKNHAELGARYFLEGYNCAQSTLLAFKDVTGLDTETTLKLASSFGGGMGRLREVCGALSGAFMVAGIVRGYTSPSDDVKKGEHYELIQKIGNDFKEQCGSLLCRDILGLGDGADNPTPSKRTAKYYHDRPCEHCIRVACDLVDKYLELD